MAGSSNGSQAVIDSGGAKTSRISERGSRSCAARLPDTRELGGSDCDLVMKGGITSGIVYPLAACELARQYRFRSIGGSSAGAIGAVLVAAAEHGRASGGFRKLAEIPIKLGPTSATCSPPGRHRRPRSPCSRAG